MSNLQSERVLSVHHWTDRLFSFTTTRSASLRFASGQFAMAGIVVGDKPLLRAYSIASPAHEEHLEFFSIKVQHGALTSRLQHLQQGDEVLVSRKPTGTLVIDHLLPGRHLLLLATGTGLAPFLSVARDPATYERFEKVVVVHGVRHEADLAYRELFERGLAQDEWLGDIVRDRLLYLPTVTREAFSCNERIPALLAGGGLAQRLALPPLDATFDRAMVCGSPAMLKDVAAVLERLGFDEGHSHAPGRYVIERAFVEK